MATAPSARRASTTNAAAAMRRPTRSSASVSTPRAACSRRMTTAALLGMSIAKMSSEPARRAMSASTTIASRVRLRATVRSARASASAAAASRTQTTAARRGLSTALLHWVIALRGRAASATSARHRARRAQPRFMQGRPVSRIRCRALPRIAMNAISASTVTTNAR